MAEVKGIYAGLVMVESKCIEVDTAQGVQASDETTSKLNNEQWQALIGLHRTLLHEHHDFFLASQHPSASPGLRRFAREYAMPARTWRHGIHSFLEFLRYRLPDSRGHILEFIYLAYSMMAHLYETVPTFEDTWIEGLGDLGRYRMSIEDEVIRACQTWTAVSRHWYAVATEKSQPPPTGRLHHHLAILARPNAAQQLFYYIKSLCVAIPFKSARDSILLLFNPILGDFLKPPDFTSIIAHGIGTAASRIDKQGTPLKPYEDLLLGYDKSKVDLLHLLDESLQSAPPLWSDPSLTEESTARSWMERGAFIANAMSRSLLEYGKTNTNLPHGQGTLFLFDAK